MDCISRRRNKSPASVEGKAANSQKGLECLQQLHPPKKLSGLKQSVAEARLLHNGPNELPQHNRRTPFRIILEVLREPMLSLLIVGGVIYLALGNIKEALILIVFACMSVLITVIQEARTERVLDALRDLTSPRAMVIRDGERKRIAGRDVVDGDLIVLSEGDRVAADARLVKVQDLLVDESLLTGEAVPVRKKVTDGDADQAKRPGGDDLPFVYSGALIVRGSGIAEVTATGPTSEIGKIGQSLGKLETETPHLQKQVRVTRFQVCPSWWGGQPSGGAALWLPARQLARGRARGHCCRHVNVARGVPCCTHGIHGHGRLAHLPGPRPHQAIVSD